MSTTEQTFALRTAIQTEHPVLIDINFDVTQDIERLQQFLPIQGSPG